MNRIVALIVVLLCTSSTLLLAQVVSIDEKIITFDKLSKTVIAFVASAQPTITTEPSLEGQYTLAFADGRGTLTFAKPVQAGSYIIRLSASGKTAATTWNVLPSRLDARSMQVLSALKLYYGKRIEIMSRLPIAAELPLQQFKIDYQFGSEAPRENNPYSGWWTGSRVPASAKTVKVSIVWIYPMTGERVPLFTKETQPEQVWPEIYSNYATCRSEFDTQTNSYTLFVSGINVDYEVPIDADNNDPNNSKSIRATLQDVQADIASIDYNSDTRLSVYRGDEPDSASKWSPNSATFKLVENRYDPASGRFSPKILMSGLPASGTSVRGTIAVNVGASITNKKAGISAQGYSVCILVVNIPINTNKTIAEGAPILETKTTTLTADVFLKRQPWFSERFKAMDFDVFYTDAQTAEAMHNVLTPRPERTPALEAAEQECTITDEIRKLIAKKLPVSPGMIEFSKGCELVNQFYSTLARYEPVTQVVMLVSKPKTGKPSELLGALALKNQKGQKPEMFDWLAPIKIYSVADAKMFTLNGTSLFDVLVKQISMIEQSVIERKVTVETTELVPVSSKGSTLKKRK